MSDVDFLFFIVIPLALIFWSYMFFLNYKDGGENRKKAFESAFFVCIYVACAIAIYTRNFPGVIYD